MDKIDKVILSLLQEDATLSLQQLSEAVHLSPTPCWRRLQRLEQEGYILRKVALLSPQKLGVGVTVFVAIRTTQHNDRWMHKLRKVVDEIPEIVEFYRMSGEIDYLLRVVVPDVNGYDAVYKRLVSGIELSGVSSSFAMEQIKWTTALPLDYLPADKPGRR
ncbi:Lrp/AsnC family transcriptional regulator [Zeimonas arvi]|uniref:Lrp/AsnC family transcriptional regulator n=1 Tax=Zeimonas arvi TaxID=2498847 RepID=A0A5C8NXS0_9BURK|nr:Lrp/AsnC family transcriptional regulator [Zeimonas arvi]TXL66108.1 Lrp/AsnC family transcriptional regulator [Zeimonas arvi]